MSTGQVKPRTLRLVIGNLDLIQEELYQSHRNPDLADRLYAEIQNLLTIDRQRQTDNEDPQAPPV